MLSPPWWMLGSWPGQISCETPRWRNLCSYIVFQIDISVSWGNTDVSLSNRKFSFTVCLGKSEFLPSLWLVLFLVVSWAVKCRSSWGQVNWLPWKQPHSKKTTGYLGLPVMWHEVWDNPDFLLHIVARKIPRSPDFKRPSPQSNSEAI